MFRQNVKSTDHESKHGFAGIQCNLISSSWEFDGYVLKHGRWDFNCRLNGKTYQRVLASDGKLYSYPVEGGPKEVVCDPSEIVVFINGVETPVEEARKDRLIWL